ncbi:hypothetical protein LJR045_002501 [Microbacterium sp. LjRoot45]|uniref:hypothetical protein n=1 Tax=Microbacterium sp. LjRoot45 TaxID=3342329 RepID=UPI003ECE274D
MVSRPGILLPLAVAVALLTSGCTASADEPEQVDAGRVSALEAAPPFDAAEYGAAWSSFPSQEASQATPGTATRGGIRTSFPLDDSVADPSLEDGWDVVFPLAQALVVEMRDNGWAPVAVVCEVLGSKDASAQVRISATAAIDGAVAGLDLLVGTESGEVTAVAVMPYPTEDADPWGAPALGGATCLDADAPPESTVAAGTPLDLTAALP